MKANITILLFGYALWLIWWIYKIGKINQGILENHRSNAEKQLRSLAIPSANADYNLIGSEVTVLKEQEEIGRNRHTGKITSYHCTRIIRGKHGNYFYSIYRGDGTSYIKPIPDGNAKILLGEKFVPKSPNA